MSLAYPMQKLQDWITQQWVIFRGRKIEPEDYPWLMEPFGNLDNMSEKYVDYLAQKEGLIIEHNLQPQGLIASFESLDLSTEDFCRLSKDVIRFYENTTNYNLNFSVHWNPLFRLLGVALNKLFSNRINQLNIPTRNFKDGEAVKSEIITLKTPDTFQTKYTIWLRTIESSGQILYSGVYGLCRMPSGKVGVKAAFPLPNGNATVIMLPSVGANGELILESSGNHFGDAGFYFLLKDAGQQYHAKYIKAFRDKLVIGIKDGSLSAEQTLTLWYKNVLSFYYKIDEQKLNS